MFNLFKKNDVRVNDIVRYSEEYTLVTDVDEFGIELMSEDGSTFRTNKNMVKKSEFASPIVLSEPQSDKYFNRTPEQIKNRKVSKILRYLTSDEDVRTYFRIDALKRLVERDMDQGGV